MSGGYASTAPPSDRLASCQPAGAGFAASTCTGGTAASVDFPSPWPVAEVDDWHPATATETAATAIAAAARIRGDVRLVVAVTIAWPAVVVTVVVAAVVLRDTAATSARGWRGAVGRVVMRRRVR